MNNRIQIKQNQRQNEGIETTESTVAGFAHNGLIQVHLYNVYRQNTHVKQCSQNCLFKFEGVLLISHERKAETFTKKKSRINNKKKSNTEI